MGRRPPLPRPGYYRPACVSPRTGVRKAIEHHSMCRPVRRPLRVSLAAPRSRVGIVTEPLGISLPDLEQVQLVLAAPGGQSSAGRRRTPRRSAPLRPARILASANWPRSEPQQAHVINAVRPNDQPSMFPVTFKSALPRTDGRCGHALPPGLAGRRAALGHNRNQPRTRHEIRVIVISGAKTYARLYQYAPFCLALCARTWCSTLHER